MASHGSESSAVLPGRAKPGPKPPDLAKETDGGWVAVGSLASE
jgi:hypothetical protein